MQGVRLAPDILAAVERWRADQSAPPRSRADALRVIVTEHLRAAGYLQSQHPDPK